MPMCNAYVQCLWTDGKTQVQVQVLSCAFAAKNAMYNVCKEIKLEIKLSFIDYFPYQVRS